MNKAGNPREIHVVLTISIAMLLLLISLTNVVAQNQFSNFLVGAYGDDGSVRNLGVRVEIRTITRGLGGQYDIGSAFWVGDILTDGAFIQFGYQLVRTGYYCLIGSSIGGVDSCPGGFVFMGNTPHWFWEYFPLATEYSNDHYWQTGSTQLSGAEGAWHVYTVEPATGKGWQFSLDGQVVANFSKYYTEASQTPVQEIAEKIFLQQSSTTKPGPLGPVEFQKLAYLNVDGWHQVTLLYASVGCGISTPETSCLSIPYGVASEGANSIIVGTGIAQANDSQLLWNGTLAQTSSLSQNTPQNTQIVSTQTLLESLEIGAIIVVVTIAVKLQISKKSKQQGSSPPTC